MNTHPTKHAGLKPICIQNYRNTITHPGPKPKSRIQTQPTNKEIEEINR